MTVRKVDPSDYSVLVRGLLYAAMALLFAAGIGLMIALFTWNATAVTVSMTLCAAGFFFMGSMRRGKKTR